MGKIKYKSRREKLINRVKSEISKKNPNYEQIGTIIDDYEAANLKRIKKLEVHRKATANKINGALRQSIHAHGPITNNLIGSATKRILGAIEDYESKRNSKFEFISFILGVITCLLILFFLSLFK